MGKAGKKSQNNLVLKPEVKNFSRFVKFDEFMLDLDFERITEETLKRNAIRFNLKPPNSERIKQTKDQIMYERWFEDYCIIVITSFNPNLGKNGGFTSVGGKGYVLVTENVSKRVYTRTFNRFNMDSFIKNLSNETELLVNRLQQRPIVAGTSLLYKIKQTYTETIWVNPLDKTDTKLFNLGKIPYHLLRHFYKNDYSTKYYQNVVRPRKGRTNRSRDKRKKWNKEVGQAVLS